MIQFSSKMNQSLPTLARAIVRDVEDPNKQGRIRVEYPWYHGNSGQVPSEWARLCLPYASNKNGMWFIPEVGDEVLVFFEHGDLDSPIVMGSLYNGQITPPVADRSASKQNDLRFIKTRSGHTLCFDDSDNGAIVLKDKEGQQLELDSKSKTVTVTNAKKNTIVMDDKEITIKTSGGGKITITDQKISIDASTTIELGQGAAMSVVLGDAFQTLFNAHTHGTAWGPSSPPTAPMTPAMLSRKVKAT